MREISLLAVGEKGKHPGRLDEGHAQFKHWSGVAKYCCGAKSAHYLVFRGKTKSPTLFRLNSYISFSAVGQRMKLSTNVAVVVANRSVHAD